MAPLEYPITRPYPWRWTTLSVAFCAGFALVGLGLFNFAAVGYNSQGAYYDGFHLSEGLGWKNKLNTEYTQKNSMRCDPNHIVVGGTYRTNVGDVIYTGNYADDPQNAIFALNVESLRDPVTTAPLGSANYTGDVLDSCRVNRIYMMAQFATHEAKYQAQVACQTSSLFANFTVESVVTLRSGVANSIINLDTLGSLEDQQSKSEAVATSVLYALGLDVLASIFFFAPPVPTSASVTNASASSLWAEWDPLASNADMPLVLTGLAAADGSYFQSSNQNAFQGLTMTARRAIQNYAIGLHSAILVDVGSTVALAAGQPDTNILTNITALKTRIQTSDLLVTLMTQTNGSANGVDFAAPAAPYLLNHTSQFRLPIAPRQLVGEGDSSEDPGPARLVQRYLCHSLVLKPTATLIVDVLVATMSMFMVAWGIAQLGLMYVAKEHTTNGRFPFVAILRSN
ncbi:hypothetical protein CTheo_6653 [Ceratobasidium theobromae]|uniref:Transmembrane protein n=1 Tax=Ceratobasidium theobromae TaxID=1582974 RepID=A0A5N5QDS7_9AGAM|nr:hypothetical protein CTheo_6653 [Ceratobasidium theobromae]